MKSKFNSTYRKIITFIFFSSVLFILLFISLFYYTIAQEKSIYESTSKQFSHEINSLVDLKSVERYNIAVDYTFWDEFIDYIYKERTPKDEYWYEINVGSGLETFDVDYFGTYDIDGNFIIENITEKISGTQIISKSVLPHILKERLTKFYYTIPEGILEVHAATIHPYSDPEKTKTEPEGFFIVAKLLDNEYFSSLENISSSSVELVNPDFIHQPNETHVSKVINLKNENNEIIKKLNFERPFSINFKNSKKILIIIVAGFILNLIASILLYKKIIYKPLNLVTKILEQNSKSAIKKLKTFKGEFGYIGKLFFDNKKQEEDLKNALVKAEESDRLKSTFLTNMSHEIRTPMNAIIGFTDLLDSDDIEQNKKKEYIDIVKKSGRSLISIIDDLVDISKLDSNQVTPNYSYFDLDEFLLEIKYAVEITIPKNKLLKIGLTLPETKINSKIRCDEIKLKQILINLLTNAIKFTEEGTIYFGYKLNADKSNIIFNVKDKGIGISESDQKTVFNRFMRIQSDNTKLTGLGLGLAISKAYVELLNGTIWVDSKKDYGTTFSFSIPFKLDHSSKSKTTNNSTVNIIKPSAKTSVVVAEDDEYNFILIERYLANTNYKIIRAENGVEAVDICRENESIEFVLMDIKMPKLNGIEAQKQIKEFNPSLPIIACTAYSSGEMESDMEKAGFLGCLIKPLDKEELFSIIHNIQKPILI